jgi:hypothetical protein
MYESGVTERVHIGLHLFMPIHTGRGQSIFGLCVGLSALRASLSLKSPYSVSYSLTS